MQKHELCAAIEAVLFAAGEPVEPDARAMAINFYAPIFFLLNKYDSPESGLMLLELSGSFQLCTKPAYGDAVKRALLIRRNTPLSAAAMEVLAVVAYNQPVTRAFVEQVRGVDSSQTVSSLVEKGLLEEAGRLELPGRPIAYQVTPAFLRTFGISSLSELPPLPEEDGQAQPGQAGDPAE